MLNTPFFYLQESAETPYYERASYTWSPDSIRYINTVNLHTRNYYLYMQECGHLKTPVLLPQNSFVVKNSLRRIFSIHQKKATHAEVLAANIITNIITELLIQRQNDTDSFSSVPDFINDTVSYIQSHYMEALSLDKISKKMNISKYHLSREFTRYMGNSINQYIINCRITHVMGNERTLPLKVV